MFHSSRIELSESALRQNVRFLKGLVGARARFSSVVKGNAYGHGIESFVPLAERCGVDHFSVASAHEALRVFESRRKSSEIMIMGLVEGAALEWAVENDIAFFVFDLERLTLAAEVAERIGRPARIHLELETGMHRTGLELDELVQLSDFLKEKRACFKLAGICTHLAGAESVGNYLRIQNQLAAFEKGCKWLASNDIHAKYRHVACSAASITYPQSIMDMVRFGIAQYGFWPSQETRMYYYLHSAGQKGPPRRDPLRRVIRWSSRVMSLKQIPAGEFVGYGTSYLTTRVQRVAAVPVGYFHGFARNLSNLGYVLIRGRRAPVAGMVNMNLILVDVTEIRGVQKGDEVVIIGSQGRTSISIGSFSDMSRFLNYEVLVRLPAEIPRVVVP